MLLAAGTTIIRNPFSLEMYDALGREKQCSLSQFYHSPYWLHGMEVFSGGAQWTQETLDLFYADRKLAMILFAKVRGLPPGLRVHKGVT